MKNIIAKFAAMDPALIRGIVVAIVGLLSSLGIAVSPQLPDTLIGVVLAVLAIVQALWTRTAVTPNAKVAVVVPDPINAPEIVAAGEAATTAPNHEIISAARAAGEPDETNNAG